MVVNLGGYGLLYCWSAATNVPPGELAPLLLVIMGGGAMGCVSSMLLVALAMGVLFNTVLLRYSRLLWENWLNGLFPFKACCNLGSLFLRATSSAFGNSISKCRIRSSKRSSGGQSPTPSSVWLRPWKMTRVKISAKLGIFILLIWLPALALWDDTCQWVYSSTHDEVVVYMLS